MKTSGCNSSLVVFFWILDPTKFYTVSCFIKAVRTKDKPWHNINFQVFLVSWSIASIHEITGHRCVSHYTRKCTCLWSLGESGFVWCVDQCML